MSAFLALLLRLLTAGDRPLVQVVVVNVDNTGGTISATAPGSPVSSEPPPRPEPGPPTGRARR